MKKIASNINFFEKTIDKCQRKVYNIDTIKKRNYSL